MMRNQTHNRDSHNERARHRRGQIGIGFAFTGTHATYEKAGIDLPGPNGQLGFSYHYDKPKEREDIGNVTCNR
jgi:hypothetical protein